MNRWIVSGLLLLPIASAFGQTSLREELQERYDRLTRLTMRMRQEEVVELTSKWLTSDYAYGDLTGTEYSAEAFLERVNLQFDNTAKYWSYSNKIIGMKVEGVSVVVTVKSITDFETKGFAGSRNVSTQVTRDYWVKTINGWKMKKTVTVSETNKQIKA